MKSLIVYITISIVCCGIGYLVATIKGLLEQQDYHNDLINQLIRRVSKLERRK